MLQYPTNFYPKNVAIDCKTFEEIDTGLTHKLSFIFNGDILTRWQCNVYDYITGELVTTRGNFGGGDFLPRAYNGDEITAYAPFSLCTNGRDYVAQLIMTQSTTDGTENIYDMPVLRGAVISWTSETRTLEISKNIENIYEWGDIYNNVRTPRRWEGRAINGMIIQIGDETRFIESYNKTTGELVVDSAFTATITEGARYQIYSNYLITPEYYFMCRTKPTAVPLIEFLPSGIKCTSTYSQAQNCLIKYYEMYLYKGDTLVDKSDKIFSQKIEWISDVDYTKDTPQEYTLQCKIVTQENMVRVNSVTMESPEVTEATTTLTATLDETLRAVKLTAIVAGHSSTHATARARIYRTDVNNGDNILLGIITSFVDGHDGYHGEFIDYTVSNHGRYKYRVVPFDSSDDNNLIYTAGETDVIETDWIGYSITAIYDSSLDVYDSPYYQIGDTWTFLADIDDSTIIQNGDKLLHVGCGQYSSVSSTEVNYSSGTVSAMIGYLNCANKEYVDTIELVKAWRKFIMQPCAFMLKSQKGDVWIVNITDTPSTTYQENYYKIPTRFSFSWAECADRNDIMINDQSAPTGYTNRR